MGQEREESEGFYEMLWDCDHCDARGLLGKSQRHCASCGAPQNPAKRYFPEPGDQRRVDGHSYVGADRSCPACGTPQSARANNCTHCGSVLDGAAEVRGVMSAPAVPANSARPTPRLRLRTVGIAIAALVGGGLWWSRCMRTESADVVVGGHSWVRTVTIEEFNDQTEEAWRNELPPGASLPICHDREHGTRQVPDGEECHTERHDKKDGTFEQVKKCRPKTRAEPVIDSWCRFTARRWRRVDEVKATGKGLSPQWPASVPAADAPAQLGGRRAGTRSETLTLEFTGHGTCEVAEPVWRKYSDGDKRKLEVRARSGEVVCSSL